MKRTSFPVWGCQVGGEVIVHKQFRPEIIERHRIEQQAEGHLVVDRIGDLDEIYLHVTELYFRVLLVDAVMSPSILSA